MKEKALGRYIESPIRNLLQMCPLLEQARSARKLIMCFSGFKSEVRSETDDSATEEDGKKM